MTKRWMVLWKKLVAALLVLSALSAHAEGVSMGFAQLPQTDGGQVTVYYPAAGRESVLQRGPFRLLVVQDGEPVAGNGHLVVISHGSGGSPWVHADLARALVQRGFTVALPQHQGDNYLDPSKPGPVSWRLRPHEVSQAIDIVAQHAPLASLLKFDAVGVFGGSAGGHTALSLAGGRWSDQRFRDHCNAHIEQDFSSCVGFITELHGGGLDGLKLWVARRVIAWRFGDATVREDADARIKAAVAMVPFAADFDPASLAHPRMPLGLVMAEKDINQIPRFHVKAVQAACMPNCEVVMDLAEAGHGAMLSPTLAFEPGSVADHLLSDPPGFDRAKAIPELNARIADFFVRHLLAAPSPGP